jgi:hypothetical protein
VAPRSPRPSYVWRRLRKKWCRLVGQWTPRERKIGGGGRGGRRQRSRRQGTAAEEEEAWDGGRRRGGGRGRPRGGGGRGCAPAKEEVGDVYRGEVCRLQAAAEEEWMDVKLIG